MAFNRNYANVSYVESPYGTLNEYVSKCFGWMFAGLLVTFAVAVLTAASGLYYAMVSSMAFILTTVVELVLVFVLTLRISKLQPSTATAMFFAYSALNGLNLSIYFIMYDVGTLVFAFLIGAVYFGVMAVYGARTERNLLGWGPKLLGGLIALIVGSLAAAVITALTGGSFGVLEIVLNAAGLLLFMFLTAYDTQMLKQQYVTFGADAAMLQKSAIIGALNLYLDFINIFLYVVELLGKRKD